VVADGLGGHQHGELASQRAVEFLLSDVETEERSVDEGKLNARREKDCHLPGRGVPVPNGRWRCCENTRRRRRGCFLPDRSLLQSSC
jgi:hypothetical protein